MYKLMNMAFVDYRHARVADGALTPSHAIRDMVILHLPQAKRTNGALTPSNILSNMVFVNYRRARVADGALTPSLPGVQDIVVLYYLHAKEATTILYSLAHSVIQPSS
jgi:hypothetical protein